MSLKAILWALEDAPTEDPTEVLVLIALADRASDDGKDAYPSREWIAERARVSVRTVQRRLNELETANIIRRGNQTILQTRNYPPDRRPTVWDLNLSAKRGDRLARRDSRGQTGCHAGSNGVTALSERGDTVGTQTVQTVLNRPEPSICQSDASASSRGAGEARTNEGDEGRSKGAPPAPLPKDWTPTAKHREKANVLGVDVGVAVDEMRRWAFAKDVRRKNWNMTFNQFLANAKPSRTPLLNAHSRLDEAIAAGDFAVVRDLTGVRVYDATARAAGFVGVDEGPKEAYEARVAFLRSRRDELVAALSGGS